MNHGISGDIINTGSIDVSRLNNGWQPIETAPKDYSDVLLFFPETEDCDEIIKIGFYEFYDNSRLVIHNVVQWTDRNPTHWMPLPTPPGSPLAINVSVTGGAITGQVLGGMIKERE